MQLGAVLVFDAGPLQLRNGGIDVERLRAYTAERLVAAPRARQRRTSLALGQLAFFADDPAFQLDYHVRHASLPRPGDERALKRLAGRVFSQALDPDKPLWELWVVEGLDERRFALIAKLDSALVEGDGPGDLLAALFAPATPKQRSPRGTLAGVGEALFEAANAALRPATLLASAVRSARGVLAGAAEPSHCRLDWLPLDAADVTAVARRLGAREADVLLATLAGGLRRLRDRRGGAGELAAATALTPICVERGLIAPRVRLPLDEPDPRTRLVRLRAARERLAPTVPPADRPLLGALAELARVAAEGARADLVMAELAAGEATLLGAPLRAVVPILPRSAGGPLRVTATRLGARIFLGLAADAVSMSDLSALADGVAASFDELRRLAGPEAKPAPARRPRARRRAQPAPRAEPELR